jgi:1,4-dihydroxy-2-naphthoyl-CoA hydrolase
MNKSEQLDHLNRLGNNNMVDHLGIVFTDVGEKFLSGKMPVDHRTTQPLGYLHGGASTAFAETLASVAGTMQLNIEKQFCMGLEINANHIKKVQSGWVHGKANPIHIGKKSHVWEIRITNDEGELVCISRMTLAVINKK